jgi:hypothetical protein
MDIHGLPHPPYRLDVASCNFWLFGYLKMKLEGTFCHTPAAVLTEFEETLGNISITEWVKVLDECKDRLKLCIEAERI